MGHTGCTGRRQAPVNSQRNLVLSNVIPTFSLAIACFMPLSLSFLSLSKTMSLSLSLSFYLSLVWFGLLLLEADSQLIPGIIIGLPSSHYQHSPCNIHSSSRTMSKTQSLSIPIFPRREDKSLGKDEESALPFPGSEFLGISRHKFDEPQSNKSTSLF